MNKSIKKLAVVVGLGLVVIGTSFAKTVISITTPIVAIEHKTEPKMEKHNHYNHHNEARRFDHKEQMNKPTKHHFEKHHPEMKKEHHRK